MGVMDLLKADFVGAVGEVVGSRPKGKSVIRAKQDGGTVPTEAQFKNVRAFEGLNRLSAGIAKNVFRYTARKQTEMLNHNVVAKLLKGMIKDHYFDPMTFQGLFPQTGHSRLRAAAYDRAADHLVIQIDKPTVAIVPEGGYIITVLCDSRGYVYGYIVTKDGETEDEGYMTVTPGAELYVISYFSRLTQGRLELSNAEARQIMGFKWSTEPTLTGDFDEDGKPVYAYYFTFGPISTWPSTTWIGVGPYAGRIKEILTTAVSGRHAKTDRYTGFGHNAGAIGYQPAPTNMQLQFIYTPYLYEKTDNWGGTLWVNNNFFQDGGKVRVTCTFKD